MSARDRYLKKALNFPLRRVNPYQDGLGVPRGPPGMLARDSLLQDLQITSTSV